MVQLNEIFGNRKTMTIIQFFISTNAEVSQTELLKKLKIAKATGVKWLQYLVSNQILSLKKIGTTNIYKLENENSVVKELKKLNIILQLDLLKKFDAEVYLYGSAARGDYNENSDVDLLIIGKVKRHEVIYVVDKISDSIKRDINFKIYSALEWSMLEKKDKPFYSRVEKDRIRLK